MINNKCSLCTSKSFIYSHSQATLDSLTTHPLAAEIIATNPAGGIVPAHTGLRVLGAPVGEADWCEQWLQEHAAGLQELHDAVAELGQHDHKGATQAAFLILKYSASARFGYLLRMVPPSVIELAATWQDESVLECLSHLLDTRTRPLHDIQNSNNDDDDNDDDDNDDDDDDDDDDDNDGLTYSKNARSRARMQAFLPIATGGLGLPCAQLASNPAYVASWVDYLRFIGTHPDLFPSIPPLLTPACLETSTTPAVMALREAYDWLEGRLERTADGQTIPGTMELQAILGRQVSGVGTLHLAKAKAQTALTHACQAATERTWRESATWAACTRLTDSGGREAAWVGQCPTRPNYVMENDHWRDAVSIRLAVPLPYLALGPSACCCHDRFDRRSGAIGQGAPDAQRDGPRRRRGRRRPKPVDPFGTHEQKCPHAFSLGRHDEVQNSAIKRKLNEAGKHAKLSTVRELRADSTDRSQRKGDLTVSELSADGVPTGRMLLDAREARKC